MRIAVLGVGAVGARAARQLLSTEGITRVILRDPRTDHVASVARSLGEGAVIDQGEPDSPVDADVVVLAGPPGTHVAPAQQALARGQSVVSTSDDLADVRALLDLNSRAASAGCSVVAGAGFGPGLTCLLAVHASATFQRVDEIHVAKFGTGGPACARQHHRALGKRSLDWRDGAWVPRPSGSGRELCWFPDPIGAVDCYRAALPDALLLVPAFPGVRRVTARMAATRRDRLTAGLPMLWPTHPEGGAGAVRVEVRGERAGVRDVAVLGAMDRPAVAAGAVAALAALWAGRGELRTTGSGGLAAMVETLGFLNELHRRGVRAAAFQGDPA